MKYTIFILTWFVLMTGCQIEQSSSEKLFSNELTTEEKSILSEVIAYADSINPISRSSENEILQRASALKGKKVEVLPIFQLNMDKFYESPSPERILISLEKNNNHITFLVHEKDNRVSALSAEKQETQWRPQSISDLEGSSKILGPIIKDERNSQFQFIQFGGLIFITYLRDGERVYQFPRQETISGDKCCAILVDLINAIKEARSNGDELYL